MYIKSCERAWRAIRNKDPIMVPQADSIEKDLEHTLYETKEFSLSNNLCKRLRDILYAIAYSRPDMGYVPIMNSYAGVLVLNCKNVNAFNILSYFLTIPIISYYINMDRDMLKGYGDILERLIHKYLLETHEHLKNQGYQFLSYVHDAMASLYVRSFPYEVVVKVWDRVIGLSEGGLFQVALSVFKALKEEIFGRNAEDISILVKSPLSYIDEESIFKAMEKLQSVPKDFNMLKLEYITPYI